MPGRAFIPGPIAQAEPRVYKSFRPRQIRGLMLAAVGAVTIGLIFGIKDVLGVTMTFTAALPGFAYGYYEPDGKPVEYWLRVVWRFHAQPRRFTAFRPRPHRRRLIGQIWRFVRVLRRMAWMELRTKEEQVRGR
jgi:hypothetical protein